MRNIRDMWTIQIDITNVCNKTCSNCTRFCGHYTKDRLYNLDLNYIEDIIISLKDYNGCVGLIGGEPTLHPNFLEICEMLKKYRPDDQKRGLWTNDINSSNLTNYFNQNLIIINPHNNDSLHTPLLVSSEHIKNRYNVSQEIMDKLIDECWIQNLWSATVNKKGAYFCEVAGMLAYLLDGPDGLNIYEHPDWWKYDLDMFKYQIDWACKRCGGAMPLKSKSSTITEDDISEDMLEKLKQINSPKIKNNKYFIYNDGLDMENEKRHYLWQWEKK